jgi:hypothetical protein
MFQDDRHYPPRQTSHGLAAKRMIPSIDNRHGITTLKDQPFWHITVAQ